MKVHHAAVVLLALCAGCAQRSRLTTYNTNYEEVWLGTLDAVSDHLEVDYADKKRGLIIARSDTRWVCTEARVEIIKKGPQYDVSVTAKDEKLRVLLKPSGLRTDEDRETMCDNQRLPPVLLGAIKKRVGKTPWTRKRPDTAKPVAAEAPGKAEKGPAEKKSDKKPAAKKPEKGAAEKKPADKKPAEKKPAEKPAAKGSEKAAPATKAK